MTKIRFGTDREVSLQLPADAVLNASSAPFGQPIDDLDNALRESLNAPIEFPALNQMVLPDDTVALAIEPGLPCAAELVAGTVNSVIDAGVPPELIQIVRAADDRAISNKKLLSHIDAKIADRLTLLEHEPDNREQLGFLGASKEGNAIYVNRTLADAEVVLPIGVLNPKLGIHSSWFPTFADTETQQRFRKTICSTSQKKQDKLLAECEEVGWMLGIQFVIYLVPAGDDMAMHVLSGLPQAVSKQGAELLNETWNIEVDEPANLVVAGIGGGPEQQTWENVTRTISELLHAVKTDGTIAICSELKSKPGPALRRLARAENYEDADRAIRKKTTPDALAADRLNRALQQARIYLLSELEENDVEELGVAYVSSPKEIAKLSSQFDTCLTLENAQHVSITRKADHD